MTPAGRPLVVGVAAAVVLLGGLVASVVHDGDGEKSSTVVAAASAPEPTTSLPSVTTPTPTATAPASSTVPVTVAAAPPASSSTVPPRATATTAAPTTTVPARPACRNSGDPACGPFWWDPAPAPNQPLRVDVAASPVVARAGSKVAFRIVGEDPDAEIANRFGQFGDGTSADWPAISGCVDRHGPWDPPAPEPGRMETTVEHVYDRPGTYTAVFTLQSAAFCGHPYGSTGRASVTVVISP